MIPCAVAEKFDTVETVTSIRDRSFAGLVLRHRTVSVDNRIIRSKRSIHISPTAPDLVKVLYRHADIVLFSAVLAALLPVKKG